MACLKISPFAKQCFVTLAVAVNVIGHGVTLGFSAILLPQLHQDDSPITLSKTADSWIASLLSVALPIGSFAIPFIMGPFGRKTAHYIVSLCAIVGWITTFLANSIEALLSGKIIQGLSLGMMLPLRCVMLGEYSSPKTRGAFLTAPSLSQGLGIFFVHFIGSFLTWQYTALVCVFLPLISITITLFIPESPSWLAAKGRYEECKINFHWLRGYDEDEELDAMIQARKEIDDTKTRGKKTNIIEIIKKKEFYKPIVLIMHIYVLSLLSGSVTMAAYSTKIIKLIMNPGTNAKGWMIGLDALRILINILAIYIINKVSRRTMIFATGGLCSASYIAISTYVFFRNFKVLTYQANWLPGLLITLQIVSVALGMVPMVTVAAGEVFPLEYRSFADSVTVIIASLTSFIILKTFVELVDSVGIEGTYIIYAGVMAYCLVVIWFLMPETNGKTLLQIEEKFSGKMVMMKDVEQRQCLETAEIDA